MALRSFETTGAISPPYHGHEFFAQSTLHLIMILDQIENSTAIPFLSERLEVSNKKLDATWLPEGSQPLEGGYHLEGYTFAHKDSKDPQRLIEDLADGSKRHHIYYSRGISHDVIIDPMTGQPSADQRFYDTCLSEPIIQNVEHWGVGHLIAESESGPWTEVQPVAIHDVADKPQMCAPSVFYADGLFHMIIQAACFTDNYPIYHLTSSNGTDFHVHRKLIEPIYGTSESGVYDVDIVNDDGKFFVVYSAMVPMNEGHKAVNEIHLAYVPSLEGDGEAERLVKLDDGLWVRVVKLAEGKYGYYSLDDTENTSRIVHQDDGTCMRLTPDDNGSVKVAIFANGTWSDEELGPSAKWNDIGYLSSPQPGTPILNHTEIPRHNAHPPIRQADETEEQRVEREQLEANFEWGLEGMQIVRLPSGSYVMLGVCFLSDVPIGSRQRAFMAVSENITGPFTPLGLLVDPSADNGWGDGENGHPSAEIIGDNFHILYQARKPYLQELPLADRLSARWQLGEAVCDIDELCRLAQETIVAKQKSPRAVMN